MELVTKAELREELAKFKNEVLEVVGRKPLGYASLGEAAKHFGVSRQTLWRRLKKAEYDGMKVPCIRASAVSTRATYSLAALERLLSTQAETY